MILKCDCGDHRLAGAKYQNEKYGYGRRVYNRTRTGGARCTICLRVINATATKSSAKAQQADT